MDEKLELDLIPMVPAIPDIVYPAEWKIDTPEKKAKIKSSLENSNLKHGLLASIPMICRDSACPYKQHCVYQQRGEVTAGERCVLEIGKLMKASDQYYNEFQVNPSDPDQRTDAVLIQQLLTLEIMIERCNMLLASGNLVEEIDVAISPTGDVISQPQLHKAAEALPKFQRQQNYVLQLLAATRKDKLAAAASIGMSIDQFTKQLIDNAAVVEARLALMRKGDVEQANTMGIKYAVEAHTSDVIDTDYKEIPEG